MVGGIDVEDAPARVGFRFGARGHGDALLRLAGDAVRIAERELAFVAGGGLEIQDAAGKAFGHGVGHALAVAVDPFAADAQQRERRAPGGRARLAEADLDGGIPVGVPFDGPFKAEVQQRGVFDMETARAGGVLGREGAGGEEKQGSGAHGERPQLYGPAAWAGKSIAAKIQSDAHKKCRRHFDAGRAASYRRRYSDRSIQDSHLRLLLQMGRAPERERLQSNRYRCSEHRGVSAKVRGARQAVIVSHGRGWTLRN